MGDRAPIRGKIPNDFKAGDRYRGEVRLRVSCAEGIPRGPPSSNAVGRAKIRGGASSPTQRGPQEQRR